MGLRWFPTAQIFSTATLPVHLGAKTDFILKECMSALPMRVL